MNNLINSGIYIKNKPLKASEEKTIIVLGMARSGTSMVARVLEGMNVFLGDKKDNAVFEDVEIAEALEKGNIKEFESLVKKRNASYKVWGWKRPSSLNHVETILKNVRNPHFIIVYRDLLSIALRNQISMEANIDESLKLANQTYNKINEFVAKTNSPLFLISYEKAIVRKRLFIKELANFIDFKLTTNKIEQVFKLIEFDRIIYLENSNVNKFSGSISCDGESLEIKAGYPSKPSKKTVITIEVNDDEKSKKNIEVFNGEETLDISELLFKNGLNKVNAINNETQLPLNQSPLIFNSGEKAKTKSVFIFTHIPKTAGTSFRLTMEKHYSKREFFPTKEAIRKNKGQYLNFDSLKNEPIKKIRQLNFLAGHFTKASTKKIPFNASYIIFFRKPIDRIISNLIHFKANDTRCAELSLDEIFEQRKGNIIDLQIKYILNNLKEYPALKQLNDIDFKKEISKYLMEYDFFGIKERLDDSILLFNEKFGFNIAPLKNQNPKKLNIDPLPSLIAKINTQVHHENILYDAALEAFNEQLNQIKA